jgi:hypothetical protein
MSRRARYAAVVGLVGGTLAGVLAILSPFASEGDPDLAAEVALTFQDGAIDESSGLVVRGDRIYTMNDSGGGPVVYAVDRRTGETAATTTFADEDPEDLEALAPGRRGSLWVGDTGDNRRERGSIRVYHLTPPREGGQVAADSFDLAYPDGPHDAEALLVRPGSQRLFVVSKRPFIGGVVYRAPKELGADEVNRLEPVARVSGMITDGTFLPDGEHVLLRTVGGAAVYTFPGWEKVAEFVLPLQDQGEGIAVGPDGRVYLSSEGEHSDVLVMDLPPLAEPSADPTAGAGPQDGSGAAAGEQNTARDDEGPAPGEEDGALPGRPAGYAVAAVLGSALVAVLVRASRRRSRRRL